MTTLEIISVVVTLIGIISLCAVFTLLFSHYAKANVNEVQSGKRDIELIDQTLKENSEKEKKKRKISKIISKIVFWLLMVILVPLFAYALVSRIRGELPVIGNESALVVASGSMSRKNEENSYLFDDTIDETRRDYQFETYDIVFLKKPGSQSEVKLYDVVAYKNKDTNKTIIHRIIKIRDDGSYLTRGDANNASDDYHPTFSEVQGVYQGKKVKVIGVFLMFFQSIPGIITIIGIVYILISIDMRNDKIDKATTERANMLLAALNSTTLDPSQMKADVKEVITYQGYAYIFDEKGFVRKEKKEELPSQEADDKTIIRPLVVKEEKKKEENEHEKENEKQG